MIEIVKEEDIEQCRSLCDELMAFQKSKASIHTEWFDFMNFDTRMKKSCEGALRSQVIIAKHNDVPIGYVFSTIDNVGPEEKNSHPDWASMSENGLGFYPAWMSVPQKIGCLNNLYLRSDYRGAGLGSKLCYMAMEWLESFSDVNLSFVYISNGNEAAFKFYLVHGFIYSHEVFDGFIKAAYKQKF